MNMILFQMFGFKDVFRGFLAFLLLMLMFQAQMVSTKSKHLCASLQESFLGC